MRAVILAGGLGTRLRPYTTVIPKPLVPIGDRPVLEHIIRSLAKSGVDQIDLCVSHLGQLIRIYLANADLPPGLQLSFHWESEPLGTAGAVAAVPDLSGTFIVMNGDVLTTLDYGELFEVHRRAGNALTIATHRRTIRTEYGVLHVGEGSDVTQPIDGPEFTLFEKFMREHPNVWSKVSCPERLSTSGPPARPPRRPAAQPGPLKRALSRALARALPRTSGRAVVSGSRVGSSSRPGPRVGRMSVVYLSSQYAPDGATTLERRGTPRCASREAQPGGSTLLVGWSVRCDNPPLGAPPRGADARSRGASDSPGVLRLARHTRGRGLMQ